MSLSTEDLIRRYRETRYGDPDAIEGFFRDAMNSAEGNEQIELGMHVLRQFADRDSALSVMYALQLIVRNATASLAAELRAIATQLPPRGGFKDYRDDVVNAAEALEDKAKGICYCHTLARQGAYPKDPEYLKMVDERNDVGNNSSIYVVSCRACDTRWTVIENNGDRYPTYTWAKE